MSTQPQRQLTPQERRRLERFEALSARMVADGYTRRDLVFAGDAGKFNAAAIGITLPACVVLVAAFVVCNAGNGVGLRWWDWLIIAVGSVALSALHEGIHGLVGAIFAKSHFRAIEFGVLPHMGALYCACMEPMRRWQFVLYGSMPGLVLGLGLSVAAIVAGALAPFILGIVMTIGAGGDALIIVKLLRFKETKPETVYMDHPTEVGLVVFER